MKPQIMSDDELPDPGPHQVIVRQFGGRPFFVPQSGVVAVPTMSPDLNGKEQMWSQDVRRPRSKHQRKRGTAGGPIGK